MIIYDYRCLCMIIYDYNMIICDHIPAWTLQVWGVQTHINRWISRFFHQTSSGLDFWKNTISRKPSYVDSSTLVFHIFSILWCFQLNNLVPWQLPVVHYDSLDRREISCRSRQIEEELKVIPWGVLKMEDPQVTIGFNAKMVKFLMIWRSILETLHIYDTPAKLSDLVICTNLAIIDSEELSIFDA